MPNKPIGHTVDEEINIHGLDLSKIDQVDSYTEKGFLMDNYGWVQNTSSLSTVRDTVEILNELYENSSSFDKSVNHNDLMRGILLYRINKGDIRKKWTWDARCRIKAICACGMAELDRNKQGYIITPLGKELCSLPKSTVMRKGIRELTDLEIECFRKGILTSPPVIRVLHILNENRRKGGEALSKYDIGGQLGFVGDVGFTHLEAEFVVKNGKKFNDAEGDADKWARTIISWLCQVRWVTQVGRRDYGNQTLPLYETVYEVDRLLQYQAKSTVRYIPQEMLCSSHHAFPKLVQARRIAILEVLAKQTSPKQIGELLEIVNAGFDDDNKINIDTLKFDILNLKLAGISIQAEGNYYRLLDKVKLSMIPDPEIMLANSKITVDEVEKRIEHYTIEYAETIPARLIDNLIRYGYGSRDRAAFFEMTVEKFFTFMGYEAECLGQGKGRVADVIAKYKATLPPKSYGLILDAKAYSKYNFPAGDVRKMKEYITLHGSELMQEMIPNLAFAFISMDFTTPDTHLQEIATDTAVNGTAIDVYELMKLGDMVTRSEISISDIYAKFVTNRRFQATC